MPDREAARTQIDNLCRWGLASTCERNAAERLFDAAFPFATQMRHAESIHIHVKVDDTESLPRGEIEAAGGVIDHQKQGFVKFRFPGGVNLIFSSIPVSQDELAETDGSRRPRPFIDHIGIDLREQGGEVQTAFDTIPGIASAQSWGHVAQGTPERGVHCCHVEVSAKHWVYPAACSGSTIPLEFAFGPLKMNATSGGCDLRPMDPVKAAAAGETPSCAAQ